MPRQSQVHAHLYIGKEDIENCISIAAWLITLGRTAHVRGIYSLSIFFMDYASLCLGILTKTFLSRIFLSVDFILSVERWSLKNTH